jgi:hypothetical protein
MGLGQGCEGTDHEPSAERLAQALINQATKA